MARAMLLIETSAPTIPAGPVVKANYKQTMPKMLIMLPAKPHINDSILKTYFMFVLR